MTSVWQTFGACLGHDPELWFPEHGESPSAAIAICRSCHVREECLEFALARNDIGVWGGLTLKQRRNHRAAAAAKDAPAALPPAGRYNRSCPRCGAPVIRGTYCSRVCGQEMTCGTTRGVEQHRYYGEPICDLCVEARRAGQAEYRQQRREQGSPLP